MSPRLPTVPTAEPLEAFATHFDDLLTTSFPGAINAKSSDATSKAYCSPANATRH